MDIEKMEKCLAFFDGKPGGWKSYEGEGRCSKCERSKHSVCIDKPDERHACVATIHAPGDEKGAERMAGMVAWQIQLFASPENARAVVAALRAAEQMANIEAETGFRSDGASHRMCTAAKAFRQAMRGEL